MDAILAELRTHGVTDSLKEDIEAHITPTNRNKLSVVSEFENLLCGSLRISAFLCV
jgi:hypothetical protein